MYLRVFCVSAAIMCVIAPPASAGLLVNGSFENTSNGPGELNTLSNNYNTSLTGWVNDGYNFVMAPNTADTTGSPSAQFNNALKLWGPGVGASNGLPATSPDGGNYIAADGAYQVGALQQTLSGLVVGQSYTVSFWWAAAQQYTFSGATTEQWQVSLGGQTQTTAVLAIPDHGFSGWQSQMFEFTADSATPVLSFLAVGTPAGVPPFALLDGVTMVDSPEPATLTLVGLALLAAGLSKRSAKTNESDSLPLE